MSARIPLIIGNWKMNGSQTMVADLLKKIAKGAAGLSTVEIMVCPPVIFLPQTAELLANTRVEWGAQNLNENGSGAYTGEISAVMLQEFGCKAVIVGHSERRQFYQESSEKVAEKAVAAKRAGLMPIMCVGETQQEREAGLTEKVIAAQLDALLSHGIDLFKESVVAYEPVWAIGTGLTATPEQAQSVHAFIRARIAAADIRAAQALRILYGGSVKPDNAAELFKMIDIDGGLIGGASLNADSFLQICEAMMTQRGK